MPPQAYASFFTMHGTLMIFFAITPILIGAFGNLLHPPHDRRAGHGVPDAQHALVLDDRPRRPRDDRSRSSSRWAPRPAAGRPTRRSPRSWASPAPGRRSGSWASSSRAAPRSWARVNYITTVIRLRAPGMTYMRMPLTVWGIWLTAILNVLFVPVLGAGVLLLFLDRVVRHPLLRRGRGGRRRAAATRSSSSTSSGSSATRRSTSSSSPRGASSSTSSRSSRASPPSGTRRRRSR